jgi:hypothetical protein
VKLRLNFRRWNTVVNRWFCARGWHAWDTWIGNPHGRVIVTKRWCARKGCEAMRHSYWP